MSADLITRCGGRRFVLTLGCGVATTVLTWFAKIDAGTYSVVIIATVGAYIAGNTVQRTQELRHPAANSPEGN